GRAGDPVLQDHRADDLRSVVLHGDHPHDRGDADVRPGLHDVLRPAAEGDGFGRVTGVHGLPVPERLPVLQDGLRLGDGLAAVRDHHADHVRPGPDRQPLRVLPRGALMTINWRRLPFYLFLTLATIAFVYPLVWLVSASLKPR